MFIGKINELIKFLSEDIDEIYCLDMINDLIISAAEYIKNVNTMEAAFMMAQIRYESNEYKRIIESLDKVRTSSHNVLIDNVRVLNRFCKSRNIPLIYEGNEHDRIKIAEFAKELTNEIFNNRRK